MPKDGALLFRNLNISASPAGELLDLPLPEEITESYVDCRATVGLSFHILESGRDSRRPLILLLHEFPGLAYSWRKIMPSLASANNFVVAVDQRGYGRTSGWDTTSFEATDLDEFTMQQYVSDMVTLVYALGYDSVRCIVGHDFGAAVAARCALLRPDFFKSCVLISRPFHGFPTLTMQDAAGDFRHHSSTAEQTYAATQSGRITGSARPASDEVHQALARLNPSRKHVEWYNSCSDAAMDLQHPPQGLNSFLRGYFHLRSADYEGNKVQPLQSRTAEELSKMPLYYIMPLYSSLPEVVALGMDKELYDKTKTWLTDEELGVYVREWSRTGFQGALNYYRVLTDPAGARKDLYLAGSLIEVPVLYLCGNRDWGAFADPGVLQAMPNYCRDFRGVKSIKGAGFWPQQEQPGAVVAELLQFLWNVDHPRLSVGAQGGSPDLQGGTTPRKAGSRASPSLSAVVAKNPACPPVQRVDTLSGKDRNAGTNAKNPSPESPERLWGKRASETPSQRSLRLSTSSTSSAAPVVGYRTRSSSSTTDNEDSRAAQTYPSGHRTDPSIASSNRGRPSFSIVDSPHPDSFGSRHAPDFPSLAQRLNSQRASSQVGRHDEVSETNDAVYKQVNEYSTKQRQAAERAASNAGMEDKVLPRRAGGSQVSHRDDYQGDTLKNSGR